MLLEIGKNRIIMAKETPNHQAEKVRIRGKQQTDALNGQIDRGLLESEHHLLRM